MAGNGERKWVVSVQPTGGGDTLRFSFDWPGVPSTEEAALMALAKLPQHVGLVPSAPRGEAEPRQAELSRRGYTMTSLVEVIPLR